jgi:hypothetical protein
VDLFEIIGGTELRSVLDLLARNNQDKEKTMQNVNSILSSIIGYSNNSHEFSKLMQEKERLTSKKDKLLDLYTDDIINKDEFKKRNDIIDKNYEALNEEIKQLTELTKGINSKKDRLTKIMDFLNVELKDPAGITDEFIRVLIDEVVVYPDRSVDVTVHGKLFPNVSTVRQN